VASRGVKREMFEGCIGPWTLVRCEASESSTMALELSGVHQTEVGSMAIGPWASALMLG
jgi:hypothetical protein